MGITDSSYFRQTEAGTESDSSVKYLGNLYSCVDGGCFPSFASSSKVYSLTAHVELGVVPN